MSEFEFEVPEYTSYLVVRLLNNYLDIRLSLIDRMPTPPKMLYTQTRVHNYHNMPLGASQSTPWPFMSKPPATPITDGRKRARMSEDLHCAAMDLERALNTLTDDEFKLIYDYYIVGGMSLDQIAEARGLTSRGRLLERMQRIVKKLCKVMNDEP